MDSLCARCAQPGPSCCQHRQICLTAGDVARISDFLGQGDFSLLEAPEPDYLDPGDDPEWLLLTLSDDGRRLVLRKKPNRDCAMLTETGCRLPLEIRPLICRLYPYTFSRKGISGVDPECRLSANADCQSHFDHMGMTQPKAVEWHLLLYKELDRVRSEESQ